MKLGVSMLYTKMLFRPSFHVVRVLIMLLQGAMHKVRTRRVKMEDPADDFLHSMDDLPPSYEMRQTRSLKKASRVLESEEAGDEVQDDDGEEDESEVQQQFSVDSAVKTAPVAACQPRHPCKLGTLLVPC